MTKHGHSYAAKRTSTYNIWRGMKRRCQYKKDKAYAYYGGRGINVCKKWQNFIGFLEDMGERPGTLTLDRKDNNKGYYKENCRWATKSEQMRNTRVTKLTQNQVDTIRNKYSEGRTTQTKLAIEYGVANFTISNIVRRAKWR